MNNETTKLIYKFLQQEKYFKQTNFCFGDVIIKQVDSYEYLGIISQDFLWGGGGGAYLNNRDKIINVLNDTLC